MKKPKNLGINKLDHHISKEKQEKSGVDPIKKENDLKILFNGPNPKQIGKILKKDEKKSQLKSVKRESNKIIWSNFIELTHKNDFIRNFVTEYNREGNWIKKFMPTKKFMGHIEKKIAKISSNKVKSDSDGKKIRDLLEYKKVLTQIRERDVINLEIRNMIIENKKKYNAFDFQRYLFISEIASRNQIRRILSEKEYNQCIRIQKLMHIDDLRPIVEKNGGILHTKAIRNAKSRVDLECAYGHRWNTSFESLYYMKTWCPHCNFYVGEEMTRKFFEKMFKASFPRTRPEWFRNQKGNRMELDGYNKRLGLAFEYQGIQHYEVRKGFKMTEKDLLDNFKTDKLKMKICEERGITLIQVPYFVKYVKMQDFITEEYKNSTGKGLKNIPKLDYRKFELPANSYAIKFKNHVEDKGGKMITPYYSAKHEITLECKLGHQWNTTPDSILNGNWCSVCSKNKKGTTKSVGNYLEENGIKLLSKYENSHKNIQIECKKGHITKIVPHAIKTRIDKKINICTACEEIKRKKTIISKFEKRVESNKGKLISDYKTNQKKVIIKCMQKGQENPHLIETTPQQFTYNIGNNYQWCPMCRKEEKKAYMIEQKNLLIMILTKQKITPISEFMGNKDYMKFKCEKGHTFTRTPKYLKKLAKENKIMCPKCLKEQNK